MIEYENIPCKTEQDKIYLLLLTQIKFANSKLKEALGVVRETFFERKNLLEGEKIWCFERLLTAGDFIDKTEQNLELLLPRAVFTPEGDNNGDH